MSAAPEHRKLAAIMFTDMVGYSALAQRNEALALELLEEHRRIVRDILPKHGGREVKTTGDGFLLEFPSALAAVQGAVAMQQALHERNQVQPAERQVRIRIGIHVGDVVVRDGDIHGDGVNIAARLEPLAQPGGVCVSEDVVRQIRNKLPHPMASLGPAELKHIELPVVVHRIVMPWEAESTRRSDSALPQRKPGNQRRPTSEATKFALATAVVVLVALAVWRPWWKDAPSHGSSPAFNRPAEVSSPGPLAPALAIAVKGSDASRDEMKLGISVCQAAVDRDATDARAWSLLARMQASLYENYERNPERLANAEGAARNALSLAPRSVEARLAQAIVFGVQPATTRRCLELLRQIEREAPDDPDVLVALAKTQLLSLESTASEDSMRLCDRALAARPGDSMATVWKAWALSYAGRFDEADALRKAAIERTGSPEALVGMFYDFDLNRGEIEQAKALLARFPADLMFNDTAVRLVTLFWLGQHEPERALEFVQAFPRELIEDYYHVIPKGYLVGKAHAQAGRMAAARLEWRKALETVDRLLATPREQTRLRNFKARLHFLLGETEEADRQAELYLQTLGPEAAAAVDNFYVNQLWLELGRVTEVVSRFGKDWNSIALTATGRWQFFRRLQNLYPLLAASPEFQRLVAKAEAEAAQEKKKER